ncbi:hypothetical protein WG66_008339 [Moniliophthora roreri]|nr:hypothetical protein WG66_008339 [Moniliophthora roreri]
MSSVTVLESRRHEDDGENLHPAINSILLTCLVYERHRDFEPSVMDTPLRCLPTYQGRVNESEGGTKYTRSQGLDLPNLGHEHLCAYKA